ncbi:MAG: thermonuclease family protein [Pseudomonadota bacterium]
MKCCAVLWLCCICNLALAEDFSARVIAVMDGDTVLALHDGQRIKLRLANIDAPEMSQDFGPAARLSLVELVLLKPVRTTIVGVDKYQRLVAILRIAEHSINEEQVRRGMAWASVRRQTGAAGKRGNATPQNFSTVGLAARDLIALQRQAKTAKRGLWGQAHPIPPWRWRKTHPNSQQFAH